MKKKKPFLLLEVMIAFTLVALCAVPLVRQPILFYRSQIKKLHEMEMRRLADWSFGEVKELLLKNAVAWEKLPLKKQSPLTVSLPVAYTKIPNLPSKEVKRSYSLTCKAEKKGKKGEIFRLYEIAIVLGDEKASSYRILIQSLPNPTSSSKPS